MPVFRKKKPMPQSLGSYATEMLKQSLGAPSTDLLAGQMLSATDGMLYEYWSDDVDWYAVWMEVTSRRAGVPPFGAAYWLSQGPRGVPVPISGVAFMSAGARLRVAQDPSTADTLLVLMAGGAEAGPGDPSLQIRAAAAGRARRV